MDETKLNLIYAAESEFAEKGFSGTSIRTITQRAGMNVASVHYHFGSKEDLFKAMFAYRVAPLNEERVLLLKGLKADCQTMGTSISVQRIAEILVRPMFERIGSGDPHVIIFTRALNRFITECGDTFKEICSDAFQDIFFELISTYSLSRPDLDEQTLSLRIHLSISLLIGTMGTSRTDGEHFFWVRGTFEKEAYIKGIINAVASILSGYSSNG